MTPNQPVGLHEVAKRLRRTPGEVARWYATGELPRPRWIVNNGPAWAWSTIERWAARTDRPLPALPRRAKEPA